MGPHIAAIAAERVAVDVAAAVAVQHLVFDVEVELIFTQSQYGAKVGQPLSAVLRVQGAIGFQHAGVLFRMEVLPLDRGIDADVADVVDPRLHADDGRTRHAPQIGEPRFGPLRAIDDPVVKLQHLVAIHRV